MDKNMLKSAIVSRIGTKSYTKTGGYVDNGDGTYTKQEDIEVVTLNFEDLDRVIDIICDEIIKHIKLHAQISITTGLVGNGGSTAGFGGPAAGVLVTGVSATPNTIS